MSCVKSQHYLPRFYLRSFADENGHLHAVRRDANGPGSEFASKPEHVCAENYLYEVERQTPGSEDRFIEKGAVEGALSRIENKLALVYGRLLKHLDEGALPSGDGCSELMVQLACLVASFVVRSPQWLQERRSKAGDYADELVSTGFLSADDTRRMAEEGYEGEFEAIVELGIIHASLFMTDDDAPLGTLVGLLSGMDCCFLVTPGESEFVVTSLPVCMDWANESDEELSYVYFPLSSRYAVVMKRNGGDERIAGICSATGETVDLLNRKLMAGNDAWEFLLASRRDTLKELIGSGL